MSCLDRRRARLVTALLVGSVVVAWGLTRRQAPTETASRAAPTPQVPAPRPSETAPASTARVAPTHVTWDDPAARAHGKRLGAWLLARRERPDLAETIAQARTRGPHELLLALERRLRAEPGVAPTLVEALARERDPGVAFQLARALGPWLGQADLRQATLTALAGQAPDLRAAGLVALVGRAEPEVTRFLLGQLDAHADPVGCGRAFALLAGTLPRLPDETVEQVRGAARVILAAPTADPHAVTGAAELLGRAGAAQADVDLLWAQLARARDAGALSALVQGLCLAGCDRDTVCRELARLERRAGPLRAHLARWQAALRG